MTDSSRTEQLLTVPEAMTALRVSRAKLYDLIRARELTTITIGRRRLVPARAVASFIAARMEEAA